MEKKKGWTTWRIIGIVAIVAIFGARTYFSLENEKKRKENEKMMLELSRQQMEDDRKRSEEQLQILMNEQKLDFNEMQQSLDSVGKNLEASKARFDSMMNSKK